MSRNILIISFVLALTFGVFARTLTHSFIIWDDDKNIYENPLISTKTLKDVPLFWKHSFQGLYIPVTYTTWSLIAQGADRVRIPAGGDKYAPEPWRYHLANLVLHLGSVALVMLLFYRLLGRRDVFAAAVGAAFFAFHPLQIEPVAWATGLKDVLSGFLALVTMLVYFRFSELHRENRLTRAWTHYGISFVVYVVALLAKPQLVVVPPIIAVFDVLTQRASWKLTAAALAPFFAAAFVFVYITMQVQPDQDAIFPFEHPAWYLRPLVALDAVAFYGSKLLYPFRLTVDYGRVPERALDMAARFPFWILPIILSVLILRIRNHRHLYLAGFGVALIAILPVLGLIPFGFQGQSTVADRYCYIALIGFGFVVATFLTFCQNAVPRMVMTAILPVMAIVSLLQVPRWQDSYRLFSHALEINPKSVASTYNIGLCYSNDGDYQTALKYYHRAIDLKEEFSYPWNNIGYILNKLHEYEKAITYLERATVVSEDYEGAYCNLGLSYIEVGRYDDALKSFDRALELRPLYPEAFMGLGVTHFNMKNHDRAFYYLEKAAQMMPDWPPPFLRSGEFFLKLGKFADARRTLSRGVKLQPEKSANWHLLSKALTGLGELPEALEAARQALAAGENTPGESPEALQFFRREVQALEEAVRAGDNPTGESAPPAKAAPSP